MIESDAMLVKELIRTQTPQWADRPVTLVGDGDSDNTILSPWRQDVGQVAECSWRTKIDVTGRYPSASSYPIRRAQGRQRHWEMPYPEIILSRAGLTHAVALLPTCQLWAPALPARVPALPRGIGRRSVLLLCCRVDLELASNWPRSCWSSFVIARFRLR